MLFTSNLRKAVDHSSSSSKRHQTEHAMRLAEKRAQLIRRHTCAVIALQQRNASPKQQAITLTRQKYTRATLKTELPPALPPHSAPVDDSWSFPAPPASAHIPSSAQPTAQSIYPSVGTSGSAVNHDDDDFDDWSDDDEEIVDAGTRGQDETSVLQPTSARSHSRATSGGSRTDLSTDDELDSKCKQQQVQAQSHKHPQERRDSKNGKINKSETLGNAVAASGQNTVARSRSAGPETISTKQGTIRMKNINRFSNFVKSGMEAFVLSTAKMTTKPEECHEIILTDKGPEWTKIKQQYTCVVDKPKKESKLKGLKSFIAYTVTSSLSGIQIKLAENGRCLCAIRKFFRDGYNAKSLIKFTFSANQPVTAALKETAHVFHEIGNAHEESAKQDLDPLLDCLYSYKGILAGMPDMVNVHKSAMSKLRENERLSMENKVSTAEAERIRSRVDAISYAVLAEMDFQHHERGEDFKQMMGAYLEKQAAFYDGIAKQLSSLAVLYRNA
ncbi:unnamed protein product [Anisakis simplex]|uniref:Sorting nexin lst-4 (inferred by orthology to a C. elegans protein) n=1 Tax=Anisakis simplex TaxID=6269 RepID=A0A0M3K1T8_ANISI|nr:unnamed protein product [Anisakis simplex]